jgi:ankyrin repeat protein
MKITPTFLAFVPSSSEASEFNSVPGALRYKPEDDGDIPQFVNSDKGKRVVTQYRAGIDQLRNFLVENKAPRHAAATEALRTFEGRVLEGQAGFYSSRISHVYNDGKSALDTLCAEVRNPDIPISTRVSVVENLAEGLMVCSEGTVTNLVKAAQDLRMSTGGMRVYAKKAWEDIFEQTVLEFCNRKHGGKRNYAVEEIHYVNGYRNFLAKDFGVAERTDAFVPTRAIENHLDEARSFVAERVTADALVRSMAESCLAEVREHLKDYVNKSLCADKAWECYEKCDNSLDESLKHRFGNIDSLMLISESEGKGTEDEPYTVIDQPTLLMRAIARNLMRDADVLEKEKFIPVDWEYPDAGPKKIKRITDESFYVKEHREGKTHYRNPYPSDLIPDLMPLNLMKAALMSTDDPQQLRLIEPATLWAKMREDEGADVLDTFTHPAVRRYRAADRTNDTALEELALEEIMRDSPERQQQALSKLIGNGEIALSVRIAESLDYADWHDSNGENVLHRAARMGCSEVLDKLLPRLAESAPPDGCLSFLVNAFCLDIPPVAERNKAGETPLMLAALSGDEATVRILLKHVWVHGISIVGMTALMYAASRGHHRVTQILLEMNANPREQDHQRRTALHMVRDVTTARVLITAGANVNARNEYEETPLMTAVDTDNAALVDLLASMSDLKRTDDKGETALIRAARGKQASLDALLACGADVNYQPSSGWTPLAAAASFGDVDIVQRLIDQGATIDKISVDGRTALCLAADRGWVDVVKLLLQKGAAPTLVDKEGNSPLMLAAMQGHHEVVTALLAGMKPGTPDGLHEAVRLADEHGHEAVLNLLQAALQDAR